MAKKTKRVEKWRAQAAQEQAQGGARRGGAAPSRTANRQSNRPAGMSRNRRNQRSARFPIAWLVAGLLVLIVAAGVIAYAIRSNNDDSTQLAAADLTATAAALATEPPPATPVAVDFGPIPTQPGVALANDGDVASGCWTADQRTSDGVQPLQWSAAPAMTIDPSQTYTAELTTNLGPMTWQLLSQASDVAVNNFVCLARAGYYDGAPFHRIVDNFVIQGGDPTGTGTGGPGYAIPDQPIVGDYAVGMVTMARTAQPNSSGSQFFINTADNTSTFGPNPTYINFARVIGGQGTVDTIASVQRVQGQDGAISSPVTPVILQSVTIFQGGVPVADSMPESNEISR